MAAKPQSWVRTRIACFKSRSLQCSHGAHQPGFPAVESYAYIAVMARISQDRLREALTGPLDSNDKHSLILFWPTASYSEISVYNFTFSLALQIALAYL